MDEILKLKRSQILYIDNSQKKALAKNELCSILPGCYEFESHLGAGVCVCVCVCVFFVCFLLPAVSRDSFLVITNKTKLPAIMNT